MPLSKDKNATRMRIARAKAKGVQPNTSDVVFLMTNEGRMQRLAEMISTPLVPSSIKASDVNTATDILNKMQGSYPPQRHLVSSNIVFQIEYIDTPKRIIDAEYKTLDVVPQEEEPQDVGEE